MAKQTDKNGINTGISWCDYTVNLWWGCTKVHEGCDNCYAESIARRWGNDVWGVDNPRKIIKSAFQDLDKYQEIAEKEGVMKRVFINSMSDIFEKSYSLIDASGDQVMIGIAGEMIPHTTSYLRARFFDMISSNAYPNLFFLLLTKRPSNINKYIPKRWKENPPANVMFGTSPVNQATANTLIPQLLQVKGKKFLSIEPQLGPIVLEKFLWMSYQYISTEDMMKNGGLNWIIQGGESGPHKRPFDLDWARGIQKECNYANVPYFFKQIDKVLPIPEDLKIRQFPSL